MTLHVYHNVDLLPSLQQDPTSTFGENSNDEPLVSIMVLPHYGHDQSLHDPDGPEFEQCTNEGWWMILGMIAGDEVKGNVGAFVQVREHSTAGNRRRCKRHF